MSDAVFDAAAEAREGATFEALFDAARQRRDAAFEKAPGPPRFLLEGAQSMADHMRMSDHDRQESIASMALWQLYLPSALGTGAWDFATVRERLPWSFHRVRAVLAAVESRPQVVITIFHMAAFPLLCSVIGAAWRDVHEGPLYALLAKRNTAWLRTSSNSWISDTVSILDTSQAGLRQLIAGLRNGSIRRLLLMVDGPQPPSAPGTRPLDGVSAALAIRITLLAKIHSFGIPILPIGHEWQNGRLVVTPRPLLDPATVGETETIDTLVQHLEDLLRRHPEQWLNWTAARIRT